MSNTPPCCPIERLIEHSAEHFIPQIHPIAGAKRRDDGTYDINIDRPVTRAEANAIFKTLGVDYSEPASPPSAESFEQLAQRRVKNLVFMDRLLDTLGAQAPSTDQRNSVHDARAALDDVIDKVRQAIRGR